MRIAVAGGTGKVGSLVVAELTDRDIEPVVLARSEGVDLLTGTGIADKLTDVDAVIDCFDFQSLSRQKAISVFTKEVDNLLTAETQAGVSHHVALSIIGVDNRGLKPMGYYQGKLAQEERLNAYQVPYSIVRTSQWFEFVHMVWDRSARTIFGRPTGVVPRLKMQPVSAQSVAEVLVEQALQKPVNRVLEFAGPEVYWLPELTRKVLVEEGMTDPRIIQIPLIGMDEAIRDGALLPGPDALIDPVTVDDWLTAQNASHAAN